MDDNGTCCVCLFNSLTPGRFKVNFRWVIFKLILVVNGWGISYETALIWVSLNHTYDKTTLVQVMAWCHKTTSHYQSQCWPRPLSPYVVTRPQWVKTTIYNPPPVAYKKNDWQTLVIQDEYLALSTPSILSVASIHSYIYHFLSAMF